MPSTSSVVLPGAERLSLSGPPLAPDVPPHLRLRREGFCILSPHELAQLLGLELAGLADLKPWWERLPADAWLRDGGHYRFRRHGSFVQDGAEPQYSAQLQAVAHRAHWQPTTYNALHGGMLRWFEPLEPGMTSLPVWQPLLAGLGRVFAQCRAAPRWFIEAHAFRIDTAQGVGRPTPEGAHRDGVDFVAVILVQRRQVRGGETRVFEVDGVRGVRFTLEQPFTALLLDDHRVIHETTPIQPDGVPGCRDTLVLTYRGDGFLEPQAGA